jgi:prepilin-type processing-associated H-X9-DG protein
LIAPNPKLVLLFGTLCGSPRQWFESVCFKRSSILSKVNQSLKHSLNILGLGTATPAFAFEQSDAASRAADVLNADSETRRKLAVLYRTAKVRHRGSVLLSKSDETGVVDQSFYSRQTSPDDNGPSLSARMKEYERTATPLALEACRYAISAAGIQASDVNHLVTVSCSGFTAPGTDLDLIRELQLSRTVSRTHVGFMGCHGALNGLRVARAYAAAEPEAIVLVCAVEVCSLHHHYGWHPERLVANALFADGAAAVVGRSVNGEVSSMGNLSHTASGAAVIPNTEDLMTWRIRDNGFEMSLDAQVPDTISRTLKPWLTSWLAKHGQSIESIGGWAVHPGGPRILAAVGESLGLNIEALSASFAILAERGNMSSPTVLFILEELIKRKVKPPYVALGFGPGLAIEAALFQ